MRLLARDDVTVPPLPLLHPVNLVFVLEDAAVRLQLLDFLRPINECVFLEALDRKVDRFVERALVEGGR